MSVTPIKMCDIDPRQFISPSAFFHPSEPIVHTFAELESVDFLPDISTRVKTKLHPARKIKEFTGLINRANIWLCDHPNSCVRNIETVDFKQQKKDGQPLVNKSHYRTCGERPNKFIRGLRLWISVQRDIAVQNNYEKTAEQIEFVDLVPDIPRKIRGCAYNIEGETECLGQLIDRINLSTKHVLSARRLATVETLQVTVTDSGLLDSEACSWIDRDYITQNFVTVLRIFITTSKSVQPVIETIKIADFVPSVLSLIGAESNVQRPRMETFPAVFAKCAAYIAKLPADHRVLNLQTLTFRQQGMQHVDTAQTAFCEDNMHTYQVKFIRLALAITRNDAVVDAVPKLRTGVQLQYQLFVPELLSLPGCTGEVEFEDQESTRQRLQRWIKRCHIAVVSVETHHIRIFCGAENFEGFDTMHTWNRVIHHTNAAHNHIHNFLHGRTHHRHGIRLRESSAAPERFLTIYRAYYSASTSGQNDMCPTQTFVEHVMLSKSNSLCTVL
ncbi:LOW QUALITY PROTEIN: uncharacterized protein LOC129602642 [Paramacrobiotus metropolitanus]|uniref:LOW QUALITY PROTEIN: uncharacterized protein LOC129602642 n=1 Tax=Paramacrobiotus metropolitanus TaxID=2943436 RepID=UPI002445E0AA|nr:LOW QUALITY PROTEIN: uncharacterized protein LOC129602642 [Paramacrobiotus metropolitanus]